MAFDAARQRVVMFGGYRGSAVQRDTWTWDGTNWTQASPTSKPAARSDHAMAYDSTRQQVVLFGGSDNNGDDLSDTWIWNGSDWTQRMSEVSPPTRASAAMAFNPVRGETLLFGGNSGVGNIIDNATWAWDGTTWTQRVPATAPPARDLTAMAFDESRGLYIMFGGAARDPVSGGLTFLGDTWVHQTYGGACSAASDCAGGFCNDGVCCNRSTCGVCESCNGTTPGHCSAVTNTEDPDTCAFANGKSCSGIGECRSKLGEPAARPADCASGFLVDGVCCESSACGTCQTCDAAKKEEEE